MKKWTIEIESNRTPINLTPNEAYDVLSGAVESKVVTHIICLAASKHYRLRPAMTAKAWILSLVRIGDRTDKFVAKGETFWEAERIAREFLEVK